MKGVAISMIVMVAMVQLMVQPGQAEIKNCGQVVTTLLPCADYLVHGGNVPPACCTAVQTLKNDAVSLDDKKKACQCAQDAANANPNLDEKNARDLPTKCNIQTDIPISKTTRCADIKF